MTESVNLYSELDKEAQSKISEDSWLDIDDRPAIPSREQQLSFLNDPAFDREEWEWDDYEWTLLYQGFHRLIHPDD